METLLEIKGHTGQITITEKKVIIKRKGLRSLIAQGPLKGNKEIPIKSITAIEFREPKLLTNGSIQFSIHGEMGHKGNGFNAVSDENTVLFTKRQKKDFIKAKELIEELMDKADKAGATVINQLSPAEELKKFADLKAQGIITEEEFNRKKKEILGI